MHIHHTAHIRRHTHKHRMLPTHRRHQPMQQFHVGVIDQDGCAAVGSVDRLEARHVDEAGGLVDVECAYVEQRVDG